MPKLRGVRKCSINGEVHLLLPELDETREKIEDFDEVAIKELMKKEASKPLLLLREE